jgi:hypothetical protein
LPIEEVQGNTPEILALAGTLPLQWERGKIAAWDRLPAALKAGIVAMVQAAQGGDR